MRTSLTSFYLLVLPALLLARPLLAPAQVLTSNGGTLFVSTGGVLTVNGGLRQTGAALLRTAGTAVVAGPLSSVAPGTLDLATGTLNVTGNVVSSGTTTASTGTLRLNGPALQLLDLNNGTVGQLVVNKPTASPARVDAPSSFTATGGVTLVAGLLRTAPTATIALPVGATLSGEAPGQYVQGNVRVSRAVAGTTDVDFGLGAVLNAGGNNLGTVEVTRTAGLQVANLSFAPLPGSSPTNSIDRIWAISPQRQPAAGAPATLALSWVADDDGGLISASQRANAQAFRRDAGGAAFAAVGTAQDASTRRLRVAVTSFSDWTVSAAAPLAVAGSAGTAALALYPVPAHNHLTVRRLAGSTASGGELLNALGQVVRRVVLPTAETTLDLTGLAPGVYVLRLTLDGRAVARRVVVE